MWYGSSQGLTNVRIQPTLLREYGRVEDARV